MKSVFFPLAVLAIGVFGASAASADVAGSWHVEGRVATHAFTLNCDFKPDGGRLGGVCVEAPGNSDPATKAGKAHPLTAGSVNGADVSWTYPASFLLAKFDIVFAGRMDGDHMTGSINVKGHQGTFTAVRS